MSKYSERITTTETGLRQAAYLIEQATRHHQAHYDESAFSALLAAVDGLRQAIESIDARLREEEKILAE